jgi:hypothetical protein
MSDVPRPKSNGQFPTSDIGHRTADIRVGIAWQGASSYRGDRQRSIPLAQFAPLARVPALQLISLQKNLKNEGGMNHACSVSSFILHPSSFGFDDTKGAFVDTSAIIMSLDLVITSDTSVAHVAGALGIPVWLALSQVPDWRWLLEREDSPWYPTMRLFRQTRYGHWEDVFDRMAAELAKLITAANHHAYRGYSVRPGRAIPSSGQLGSSGTPLPANHPGRT